MLHDDDVSLPVHADDQYWRHRAAAKMCGLRLIDNHHYFAPVGLGPLHPKSPEYERKVNLGGADWWYSVTPHTDDKGVRRVVRCVHPCVM